MGGTVIRHKPERMCVVCHKRFPKGELARYVWPETMRELETDGPTSDPEMNLPGRGFYVCVQVRCREIFPKIITGLMKKRKGGFK